jgi:hypothetical protein
VQVELLRSTGFMLYANIYKDFFTDFKNVALFEIVVRTGIFWYYLGVEDKPRAKCYSTMFVGFKEPYRICSTCLNWQFVYLQHLIRRQNGPKPVKFQNNPVKIR